MADPLFQLVELLGFLTVIAASVRVLVTRTDGGLWIVVEWQSRWQLRAA